MPKMKMALVGVLILALAGYVFSLNKKLQGVESKYASDVVEINRKLARLHEEKSKAVKEAGAAQDAVQQATVQRTETSVQAIVTPEQTSAAPVMAPEVYTAESLPQLDMRVNTLQKQLAVLKAEKEKAEKLKAEKEKAERLKAEKLKAEKLKAEKLKAEKEKAEKLKVEVEAMMEKSGKVRNVWEEREARL